MNKNLEELVGRIRDEFNMRISMKTGWGKNEIMMILDQVILKVTLCMLDNKLDEEK